MGDRRSEVLVDVRRELPSGARYEVYLRRADDIELYPSGYKYRMYYGFPGEEPVLLYDNGHRYGEHHEHRGDDVTTLDDPDVLDLYEAFKREVLEHEQQFRS